MQPFQHHAHLVNKTPLDRLQVIHPDDVDEDSPTFALLSNFPVKNTHSIENPSKGTTANASSGVPALSAPHNQGQNGGSGGIGSHSGGVCEPTQPDNFDTQIDGGESMTCSDPTVMVDFFDPTKPWARLISKDKTMNNYELMWVPADEEGRHNLYSIGRSALNSIRFEFSPRVSSQHCMIYCKPNLTFDPNRPFYEAYIVDLSANGTFVNDTRLTKNVPRLLHKADVISLINPKLCHQPGANVTVQDVEKCSFLVSLDLFNPFLKKTNTSRKQPQTRTQTLLQGGGHSDGSGTAGSSSSSSQNLPIGRSNTVIRLLTQKRNIFDFYEFRELLGQGGVASVHLGIKKDTGMPWAIKVIDTRQFQLTEGGIDSLTKEAEMLRSLRHPNIIHLEDIFADGDKLYLVMELSHGGDLFDRILSKRHYEENVAKEAMKNILSALVYLHKFNIAHRDLKPENILLSRKDSDVDVKISDFGLAKVSTDKTKLKTYCGTPQYFAPEVLQRKNTVAGQGSYSLAADMWSIGIILYVMLAGEFPFDDPTKRGINAMKHNFNKPIWSTVSAEAKDLISKLLIKDPSDRLNADQALHHPWFTGQPYSLTNTSVEAAATSTTTTPAATAAKPKAGGRGKKAAPAEQSVRPPVPPAFFPAPHSAPATSSAPDSAEAVNGKRKADEALSQSATTATETNDNTSEKQPAPQTPSKRTRKANSITSPGTAVETKDGAEGGSGKVSSSTPAKSTRGKKTAETSTPVKNSMDKFVVKL